GTSRTSPSSSSTSSATIRSGRAAVLARAARLRGSGGRLPRRGTAPRAGGPACDLGRPARLARADGAPRRAGLARRRLSVVELGGIAQPLRVVRRDGVSLLG